MVLWFQLLLLVTLNFRLIFDGIIFLIVVGLVVITILIENLIIVKELVDVLENDWLDIE